MRLAKSTEELKSATDFDVIIENDELEKAIEQARSIITEFINK
jgi:guanylate kinase